MITLMIIDDPNYPKKDEVAEQRLLAAYKRLNNAEYGQRVTVQQRTHENDLTGYLLANYQQE